MSWTHDEVPVTKWIHDGVQVWVSELDVYSDEAVVPPNYDVTITSVNRAKNGLYLGQVQTPHNGWRRGGGSGGTSAYSGKLYELTKIAQLLYDYVEITVTYRCNTSYGVNNNGWTTQMTIGGQSMPLTGSATTVTFRFSTSEEPTWNSNITLTSSASTYIAVSTVVVNSIKLVSGKGSNVTPLVCVNDFRTSNYAILAQTNGSRVEVNQDYILAQSGHSGDGSGAATANITLDTPGCNRVAVIYNASTISTSSSARIGPISNNVNNAYYMSDINVNDMSMAGYKKVEFPCNEQFTFHFNAWNTYNPAAVKVSSIVGYKENFGNGVLVRDSKMNGFMCSTLWGSNMNGNSMAYITTHDCKLSKACSYARTSGTVYMTTGNMLNVDGYTKCDVTFTSEILDTANLSDLVTVSLSSTLPKGLGVNGESTFYSSLAAANITDVVSATQREGETTCTVTLEFSGYAELALVFRSYLNESLLTGKTKTIQIKDVRFYN